MKYLMMTLLAAVLAGCDNKPTDSALTEPKDPPLTVTWSEGTSGGPVLKVSNLSVAEGIEIYVYVCNDNNSVRSGNTVVPANSFQDFGLSQINWRFQPGDKGFVSAVKYPRKLCFNLNADRTYRTWFALDDIPEIDVAAQVRARKAAELVAKVNAKADQIVLKGAWLFVGIVQANTEREGAGLTSVWPNGVGGLKEQATDKLKSWKAKLSAKIDKKQIEAADVAEMKFKNTADYFNELFDVSNIGTSKYSPYVNTNVTVVLNGNVDQCVKDGKILPGSVLWSVIADYNEVGEMSDNVPVLVTANFPCERLCSFWDGNTKANEVIPLLENHHLGVEMQYGFVVVYADGRRKWIPSGRATLREIYGKAFNTRKDGYNRKLRYLTPTGIVVASGFSDETN